MPTTPFSAEFVAKLAGPTAWKFDSRLGPVFYPRFFCCTSPNSMELEDGKEPVAVIELSPNPASIGETVSYDGSNSYDPDGTVTDWAWTFEGHTPSSGTAVSGTLNWGSAGTYTVTLVVTDGTGLDSAPASVEVEVMSAAWAGYVGGYDGVYYSDATAPITWAARNTGLSGDNLTVYDVKIQAEAVEGGVSIGHRGVWRATAGSLLFSPDGGSTWYNQTPGTVSNVWSDTPAPDVGSLSWRALKFAGTRLFVIGTWQNGSSEWRSWLFYTDDAGSLIENPAGTATWFEV